jgi:hypothetical protein
MNITKLTLILVLFTLLSACSAGPPYMRLLIITIPPDASISLAENTESVRHGGIDNFWLQGQKRTDENKNKTYYRLLTEPEIQAGIAESPKILVKKEGFKELIFTPSPTILNKDTLNSFYSGNYIIKKENVAILEKDLNYEGPIINKNAIELTINSEPQGARIYEGGKFWGVTPIVLKYTIDNKDYKAGMIRCRRLIAVHDTHLPDSQDLELQIDRDWRYESGTTHEYATLFLLKRDPDYHPPIIVNPPPVIVQGQTPPNQEYNINIKKEKDALDLLQQAGQIGIMIKALKPIR